MAREVERILYGGVDFRKEEREAIDRVLDRNWWGLAEEGAEFEKELAEVQGTKHAVFVSSGSAALDLGINSLNLCGKEVVVPATTFPTPIASLVRAGATPVVADVDETLFLSPESFRKAITKDTAAVLLVYVAGNIGRMYEILEIAKEHGLLVIEDNCDGFGGTWDGRMVGSFGSFSAISTHAAHIISTGQGGVVFTDSKGFAEDVRKNRDWGRDFDCIELPEEYRRYTYTSMGYNYQALELQAAMGRVQLRRLDEFKEKRVNNFWKLYDNITGVQKVEVLPDAVPCWYTFPFLTTKRKQLAEKLVNVDWRPILAGNITRQPAYKGLKHVDLSYADKVFNEGMWLPVHPLLKDKQIQYMIDVINL
jgi:dTDP-4-dehydro-2,6-dideoxy-D-glucose 3-dehydratase